MGGRRHKYQVGERFNSLVVIGYAEPMSDKVYRVRCDCGAESSATSWELGYGHKKSCGCKIGWPVLEGGERYGNYTVIEYSHSTKKGRCYWCECECGKVLVVSSVALRKAKRCCHAKPKQCKPKPDGALRSKHPHYPRWAAMMRRCYNPKDKSYEDYGERGIKVYEPWHDWERYRDDIERELGPKPGEEYTVDRIDNEGNYEPGNLRWAEAQVQNANKRRSKAGRSTVGGVDGLSAKWAREHADEA